MGNRLSIERRREIVARFAELARDAERRGDTTMMRQWEQEIREVAPSLAYARKVIANLYEER
jgi:hypothetical protein